MSHKFCCLRIPALRFDKKKRLDFIVKLRKAGRSCQAEESAQVIFCACFTRKKTPDAIRMVWAAAEPTDFIKAPSATRLRSTRCYGDLDLVRN